MISKAHLFINPSLLLAVLLMIASPLSAQPDNSRQIDSLKVLFPKQEGVEKIESLYELSFLVSDYDLDSAIYYDSLALEIASHKNLVNWKVKILSDLSHLYCRKYSYERARYYLDQALAYCKNQNYSSELFIVYTDFGNYFYNINLYDSALYYYYQCLKIVDLIIEKKAISFNNIGLVYYRTNDLSKSLHYFQKSLKINLQDDNILFASANYINIGLIYNLVEKYDSAIFNFENAVQITLPKNDRKIVAAYSGLGTVYFKLKDKLNSYKYLELSIEKSKIFNDKKNELISLVHLAHLELNDKSYSEAKKHLNTSKILSTETGDVILGGHIYHLYSQLYEAVGQYDSAYYYQKKHLTIKDSVFTPKLTHNLTNLQLAYQAEESQQVIEEKEQRLSQTTKYLWLAGMVLLICVVQLFRFYHRFL